MPSADTTEKTPTPKAPEPGTQRATLDLLRGKKRKERELKLVIEGDEVSFLLRAISAKDYDRLLNECPPTVEQRANGSLYDINRFAPALLSRVVVEPDLATEHWAELWTSPNWNRGELMTFFSEAVSLCSEGLSLGPTATA